MRHVITGSSPDDMEPPTEVNEHVTDLLGEDIISRRSFVVTETDAACTAAKTYVPFIAAVRDAPLLRQ